MKAADGLPNTFFQGQQWKQGAAGRKDITGGKEMDWKFSFFSHLSWHRPEQYGITFSEMYVNRMKLL